MISSYNTLWTLVSWTCPVDTSKARAAARRFDKKIKLMGGCSRAGGPSHGMALLSRRFDLVTADLSACLPDDAELRCVPITDKQIEKSQNFWGKRRTHA